MSLQPFFGNFVLLVDASNGVVKLRELILQLAIQGRLVSQDETDESVPMLLKLIKQDEVRVAKNKKNRNDKEAYSFEEGEIPFLIPKNWQWRRLGELGNTQTGTTPSRSVKAYFGKDYPFIKPADIFADRVEYENEGLSQKAINEGGRLAPSGSILMVCIGTVGKVNVIERECSFNQQINSISLYSELNPNLFNYFLRSNYFQTEAWNKASRTTIAILNKGKWERILIPLPPLEEQKRIVARVDELMRLCDELEKRQQARRESRVRLNNATLAPVNNAASLAPEEFEQASTRLADNFASLYESAETVGKLRSTILQLAVQGRLVPQDSEDEPATALVTRIKKLRGAFADTKIAKVEQMPSIDACDMSFPLPDGWRWTRLAEICELITKGSSPKWQGISYVKEGEGILFVTSENVGSYRMLFDNRKFVEARFNEIEPRSILRRNDLLMNIVGASIGRAAVFDSDDIANINQAVCLIRVAEPALVPYLLHFFNSDLCIQMMFDQQVDNARANLSMGNIAKFPIPVPPLAEQNRIVAKANQLMALCDELDAKLRQAEADSRKLVNAAVKHALSSTTEPPVLTESSLRPGSSHG